MEDFGIPKEKSEKLYESFKEKLEGNIITCVVCPLCGYNRPIKKTGITFLRSIKRKSGEILKRLGRRPTEKNIEKLLKEVAEKIKKGEFIKSRAFKYNPKKETSFNIVNFKEEPFIIFKTSLGRGGGFREIGGIKLKEINKLSESDREVIKMFIKEIKIQCSSLLKYLESLKL